VVRVDPGVAIGPDTVIVATPNSNLRERAFWVVKLDESDTFFVRMSPPRNLDTSFSWLIVESS
jgi:hypothetical protein